VTKSDAQKCSFYVVQGVTVTTSGKKLPQTHSNNFVKTIKSSHHGQVVEKANMHPLVTAHKICPLWNNPE
jgi:hypothetical protein